MKITLPSGITLEGTADQIVEAGEKLGYSFKDSTTHYLSSTKGLVPIKEMNTTHLRNAILRFYEDWVASLHSINDPQKVVARIIAGVTDKTWVAMVREYGKREEE